MFRSTSFSFIRAENQNYIYFIDEESGLDYMNKEYIGYTFNGCLIDIHLSSYRISINYKLRKIFKFDNPSDSLYERVQLFYSLIYHSAHYPIPMRLI